MGSLSFYRNTENANTHYKSGKVSADAYSAGITALVLVLAILIPEIAQAAGQPWDSAATKILGIFTGGLARTIAIIAVVACGMAAIAGKLSWDWAIKIVIGIVLIFGATTIVDYIMSAVSQ